MVGGTKKLSEIFSTQDDKKNLIDVFNIVSDFECDLDGTIKGSGGFTLVRFCDQNSSSGKTYVIKTLYKKQQLDDETINIGDKMYFKYLAQRKFFDNYVRVEGVYNKEVFKYITPFVVSTNCVYLLEEKMDCDLRTYIYTTKHCSTIGKTNKDKAGIVKNLVEALDYLFNTLEVIHNDIKPDNINIINGKAYLADLDFLVEKTDTTNNKNFSGTFHYKSISKTFRKFHETSDYYAMGSVIYELLTNRKMRDDFITFSTNVPFTLDGKQTSQYTFIHEKCHEFINHNMYSTDLYYKYMVNQLIRMFTISGDITDRNLTPICRDMERTLFVF